MRSACQVEKQHLYVSCTAGCKQAEGTYSPTWKLMSQEAAVGASQPTACLLLHTFRTSFA